MTTASCAPSAANVTAPAAKASTLTSERVRFVKEVSGEFNGEALRYTVVAGETILCDDKGAPLASVFSVAYLGSDLKKQSVRPVTFAFNGGPGSSSQWLHMGALGPRRLLALERPESMGAPPYTLLDNSLSVLDVTDLVFIDPIGTGYSCTLGAKEAKDYWGVLEDARSITDFIHTWITENQRWNSPKYIVGESYGTTRAAVVADMLSARYIALTGIVWVAGVSNYQNIRPRHGDGGIMPYVSYIPTYAAVAWYHGKVARQGRTLESFLQEVRLFARTEYAQALIANCRITATERAHVVARLAAYTGMKTSYIEGSDLRVPPTRFFKELLRDERLVTGRLDGRYSAVEPDSVGELAESDPLLDAIGSAVTTAMHVYLTELGVRMPRLYEPMSATVLDAWNWRLEEKTPNGAGYVNVMPYLGRAMRHNRDLRVLAACGYFDLAAPFFGIENCLSEHGLVQERIRYAHYEVGHMFFLHEPSRVRFLNDVRQFIREGSEVADKASAGSRPSAKGVTLA